jgi:hypothetical protein
MTDIALDLNPTSPTYRDVKRVAGDLLIVDGTQAILQNILQTIGIFKGEWFLNNTIGIDYFGSVLVKNPNPAAINAIFQSQILNVAGVLSLTAYSFVPNYTTRQLNISFTAQTTQGIINYAGLI